MDTNKAVLGEQCEADDWELWVFAWEMNWFVEAFQIQFFSKLGGCPTPVVGYASTHARNLGMYRTRRNAFGLAHEININKTYLGRPKWSVLHTLFHEMVHAWEYHALPKEERTANWFHKARFREVMEAHGIYTNKNGHHIRVDLKGSLSWFLQRHGIDILSNTDGFIDGDGFFVVPDERRATKKTKVTWACSCDEIKLPISKDDFEARCLKCGENFEMEDD